MTTRFYIARDGFRETLMAVDGVDEYGDPAYRPATTDEAHQAWASQRNSFDDLAQRADDFASEGASA